MNYIALKKDQLIKIIEEQNKMLLNLRAENIKLRKLISEPDADLTELVEEYSNNVGDVQDSFETVLPKLEAVVHPYSQLGNDLFYLQQMIERL